MSRAFVKETEREEPLPVPPLDLPPGVPNRITPAAAARMRAELPALIAERARLRVADLPEGKSRLAVIEPRIALLEHRAPTWVETPAPANPTQVVFGCAVQLQDEAGRTRQITIVGVDEVDVARGCVSFLSPIAAAVLGAQVGDEVRVRTPRGEEPYEVLAISAAG